MTIQYDIIYSIFTILILTVWVWLVVWTLNKILDYEVERRN